MPKVGAVMLFSRLSPVSHRQVWSAGFFKGALPMFVAVEAGRGSNPSRRRQRLDSAADEVADDIEGRTIVSGDALTEFSS